MKKSTGRPLKRNTKKVKRRHKKTDELHAVRRGLTLCFKIASDLLLIEIFNLYRVREYGVFTRWGGRGGETSLLPHRTEQLFIEFLRGIVSHLLLAVIHRRDLKDDRKISTGLYGDRDRG